MVWVAVALIILAIYIVFRATVVEPYDLEVVEKELVIPGLPPELDGLRIAHLTDFHLKKIGDLESVVMAHIKPADFDLLCLTGDFVAGPKSVQFLIPFMMEMTRGRRAFAVLGNNDDDHGVNPEVLSEALRRSGVTLLVNEGFRTTVNGVPIYIAGVDDPHTGRANVRAALDGLSGPGLQENRPFVLLLAHSPDVLLDDAVQDVDLVLAGHTHGGQVCAPFIGPIRTNTKIGRRAAAGAVEIGGVKAYVSRGLGTSRLPIRLNCRPEMSFLTLRAQSRP